MGRSSCIIRVTVETGSIGCAVSELCKKNKNEISEELSAVSQDATGRVAWRPTTTLSFAHSQLETLAQRAVVLLLEIVAS